MGGFLRFVTFFVLLVAGFVLVALPLLMGPLLAGVVRDVGFAQRDRGERRPVRPGPVLGPRATGHPVATGVEVAPAQIGRIELAFGDVSFFDRSFATVSGDVDDVTLTVNGGTAHVTTVTFDGPSGAANAVARLSADDTEHLVRIAARRVGVQIDRVVVGQTGVTVTIAGFEGAARVTVQGGALILDPGIGVAIVLLQPAPSDPWSLSEAWVSDSGLNVRGVVNVERLTRSMRNR